MVRCPALWLLVLFVCFAKPVLFFVVGAELRSFLFAPSGVVGILSVVATVGLAVFGLGSMVAGLIRSKRTKRPYRPAAHLWHLAAFMIGTQLTAPGYAALVVWRDLQAPEGRLTAGKVRVLPPREKLTGLIKNLDRSGPWRWASGTDSKAGG